MFWVTEGVGYLQFIDASNTNDFASLGFINIYPLQAQVALHLQDAPFANFPVTIDYNHILIGSSFATGNSSNPNHTHVTAVIEGTDLHLE